jgi:hypothetical protein
MSTTRATPRILHRSWYSFRLNAFFNRVFPFRFQHPSCATILAPILLIAVAIGPILDDVLATARPTLISYPFFDHPLILRITYFRATTRISSPTISCVTINNLSSWFTNDLHQSKASTVWMNRFQVLATKSTDRVDKLRHPL